MPQRDLVLSAICVRPFSSICTSSGEGPVSVGVAWTLAPDLRTRVVFGKHLWQQPPTVSTNPKKNRQTTKKWEKNDRRVVFGGADSIGQAAPLVTVCLGSLDWW